MVMSSNAAAGAGPGGGAGAGASAGVQVYELMNIDPYFSTIFDNLRIRVISETHPTFPAFLDQRNPDMRLPFNIVKPGYNTVIEILGIRRDNGIGFPLVGALIRSGHKDAYVVHEIYSVSTSNAYKRFLDIRNSGAGSVRGPSIAKELMRYLLTFHNRFKLNDDGRDITETPETRTVLYWLGVQTQGADPKEITRLITLYREAGFFFPNLICGLVEAQLHRSYVNSRQSVPLGGAPIPFKFISGYWSTLIKEYTDGYTDDYFNADNASLYLNGREKDYALLKKRVEHTGFLNINDRGVLIQEPANYSFVANCPPGFDIEAHNDVHGGSYTFRDQVKYHNSAPVGIFFQDPARNSFTRFHFHTHPLVCHAEYNVARGFPSQPDIQILFHKDCDMQVGGLMVFSREGTWLIRMNPYLLFLKERYPDRYEVYRDKAEKYLEILTSSANEIKLYNTTRNYTAAEIAAENNRMVNITSMNEPSVEDLKQVELYLGLVNSRYLSVSPVDGMEMALFSVQFIKRNQEGYRFAYIRNK